MKKKKITLLAVVLATAAMFTGCTIEDEYVPVDTEVQVMETNDMGVPSLSQTLDIPDEDFKLVCEYGTNGYDLNNWRVTNPKQISMKVHTQGLPDGYDVVIDHVHADISLLSTSPQINGITQDSMDDTFHARLRMVLLFQMTLNTTMSSQSRVTQTSSMNCGDMRLVHMEACHHHMKG